MGRIALRATSGAVLALSLAACMPPSFRSTPEPTAGQSTAPIASAPSHRPGPLPTRPLNVHAQCSYQDEGGTRASMALDVADADVQRFDAQVALGRHGTCSFNLKDFRQTDRLPIAVLKANHGTCAVRLWQQHERVTVAFTDCEAQCTGNAFEYLWPILTDTRSGECS
ncbi:MAG TPA: hypothetical protein VF816_05775 [Rhodocyclaceae bacterium]